MIRVHISENDPFILSIAGEEETAEQFGDDFLDEYNSSFVPENLLERYKKVYDEFWEIQEEIRKYKK